MNRKASAWITFGSGTTSFEDAAIRTWGLKPLDARALLVIAKYNGSTCANLGAELWGVPGKGGSNCSCPFARPAGLVIKRLRQAGLVERDTDSRVLTIYRATSKVEALIKKIRRGR